MPNVNKKKAGMTRQQELRLAAQSVIEIGMLQYFLRGYRAVHYAILCAAPETSKKKAGITRQRELRLAAQLREEIVVMERFLQKHHRIRHRFLKRINKNNPGIEELWKGLQEEESRNIQKRARGNSGENAIPKTRKKEAGMTKQEESCLVAQLKKEIILLRQFEQQHRNIRHRFLRWIKKYDPGLLKFWRALTEKENRIVLQYQK